jgi:hypothetical protein
MLRARPAALEHPAIIVTARAVRHNHLNRIGRGPHSPTFPSPLVAAESQTAPHHRREPFLRLFTLTLASGHNIVKN